MVRIVQICARKLTVVNTMSAATAGQTVSHPRCKYSTCVELLWHKLPRNPEAVAMVYRSVQLYAIRAIHIGPGLLVKGNPVLGLAVAANQGFLHAVMGCLT